MDATRPTRKRPAVLERRHAAEHELIDEISSAARCLAAAHENPADTERLMEEVCEQDNCEQALKRVKANKGALGEATSVSARLVESLALSLLGASLLWLLFNGNTVTIGDSVSSLVFQMRVTPALLGVGVLLAVGVGLIGGLFPAVRAARLPVATALRAV